MSGGSLNYIYTRVQDAAMEIKMRGGTSTHRAFANHLLKIADVLHDIEWVFSGDIESGAEIEAMKAIVGSDGHLKQVTEDAEGILKELTALLDTKKVVGEE